MDKQELIALAERVEKLEGPCIGIDAEIELASGNWTPEHHEAWTRFQECGEAAMPPLARPVDPQRFTASIDAAMTLAPDHCWVRMDEWPGGFGQARGTASVHPIRDPAVDGHCAKADTLPLALCAASLRAIASQEGE